MWRDQAGKRNPELCCVYDTSALLYLISTAFTICESLHSGLATPNLSYIFFEQKKPFSRSKLWHKLGKLKKSNVLRMLCCERWGSLGHS